MNVRGNVNSAAAQSYHEAWAPSVARFWEEDRLRMEWLNAQVAKSRGQTEYTEDELERRRSASRRYARRKRERYRVKCACGRPMDSSSTRCIKCTRTKNSSCVVCGKPKASQGHRCSECDGKVKCVCGLIQNRQRRLCRECNRELR